MRRDRQRQANDSARKTTQSVIARAPSRLTIQDLSEGKEANGIGIYGDGDLLCESNGAIETRTWRISFKAILKPPRSALIIVTRACGEIK
jgi:hypothetical protein